MMSFGEGSKRASNASGRKQPADSYNRTRAGACLEDSFLVEAGAGTGKTALLMERLRNIICLRGVPMDAIVAITFTEKAAGELKSRLRAALGQWEGAAEGEEKERAGIALRAIDRATVSTIHSFCSTLLRERPVEAGVDPGFTVADEAEAEELRDRAWDSWLQERMVPENDKLRPAFSLGVTIQCARDMADSLLRARDLLEWMPQPCSPPGPRSLLAEVRKRAASFEGIRQRDLKNSDDRLLAEARKVERFLAWAESRAPSEGTDDARCWEALAPAMCDLSIKADRKGNAGNWSSKKSLNEARKVLSEIGEVIEECKAAYLHNAVVYLGEELKTFVEAYERVKQDRGVLDFDDLLIKARDLLKNSLEVRRYYKKKFRAILIDEFQDTDPLQAEVAFLLAEKLEGRSASWDEVDLERGKLFIVGDPKQSIYRFRGADIEVYERSKRILEKSGEVVPISVNFRSTPGVIDPVNLTFADLMIPPKEGSYQPEYIPLDAYREGGGPAVVLLWPETEFPVEQSADEKRAFEASAIAWSIQDAVKKKKWNVYDRVRGGNRPAAYGDIALLFRATTGLNLYEEALRSMEVPYRVAGGKAFYVRPEVRALTCLLSAVEHPHDGVAVFGALRSAFFGLSDEEIFLQWARGGSLEYSSVKVGGAVEEAFEVLRELRGLRNSVSLVAFLELLFERTAVLPSLYMLPHGEQRVANLLKMSAMASRLEESGPTTFKRFVRWVSDRESREVDEGESPIRETGDDFVTLLTIHKAKGLEFPVVFLPGLWSRGKKGSGPVVVDREAKNLQLCLNKRLGLLTRGWEPAAERENDVLEAERIRLLYVAMTRARDRLVLPCLFGAGSPPEKSGNKKKSKGVAGGGASGGKKPARTLGHLVYLRPLLEAAGPGRARWAQVKRIPHRGLERRCEKALRLAARGAGGRRGDFTVTRRMWKESLDKTLGVMATCPTVTSPTALLASLKEREGLEGDRTDFSPGAGPSPAADSFARTDLSADVGMKIGSLVHSVLERDRSWDPDEMESLASSLGAGLGLHAGAVGRAAEMLRRFSGSDFAARIRAARSVYREVPFCIPLSAIVEGAADLVIEEEDGWRVVDFKTDGVDEGAVEERAAHYRLQGACYALCLSEILKQPVRQVIFYFLVPQKAHTFDADRALLEEARVAIAAATGKS